MSERTLTITENSENARFEIGGNTYEIKEILKADGYKWYSEMRKWCKVFRKGDAGNYIDEITRKYDISSVKTKRWQKKEYDPDAMTELAKVIIEKVEKIAFSDEEAHDLAINELDEITQKEIDSVEKFKEKREINRLRTKDAKALDDYFLNI